MALPPRFRIALAAALLIVALFLTRLIWTNNIGTSSISSYVPKIHDSWRPSPPKPKIPVSYDKTTPPSIGCEDVVVGLQKKVIEAYAKELKGIRYANIFGYLGQTENKGDAAIWIAQDILLATLGIKTMEVCRYIDKDCDFERFSMALEAHKPHSAIIMAGGGNFNDLFWDDQPARIKMVEKFSDYPIRMFPQSINMTHPEKIKLTLDGFSKAKDLQLAARDRPSYEWLKKTFGDKAAGIEPNKVRHILTPDVAFMFGSRPDIRLNTKKTHQIYILARDDSEVAEGASKEIAVGEGTFDFGPDAGHVSYLKNDWRKQTTPDLNGEEGKSQRNFAKTLMGFEMLAQAEFVITDRLHGHIMSTIMGIPHVLMDSRLKKNLFLHDTWTKECGCVRVAGSFEEAKEFARMYFEKKAKDEGLD
ncbi:hypothetical protein NA57DRAFT_78574 [Rhizodiscina lignyota]|uniref:Polysaccharide pyruvyl transferase domain-containing protein n=1 Tax=Rhizodiscina lignyota TaxID=1504668 RepID=A0A9P4IBD3_9PEZI|nr:hypothetical protein NA57DRAFT_78574 [Rhizodiscina lignyota]